MKPTQSQTTQGNLYIIAEAVLWSTFPVVTILAYSSLTPIYTAAFSVLFASGFFAVIITIQKKWKEIFIRSIWKDIIGITLINSIFFYAMVFIGLKYTSAGNASIVFLMEVFFSYIIFRAWGKDHLNKHQSIGAIFMAIGAIIILFPNRSHINIGDIIILIATAIVPFGNHLQQKVRKQISSSTLLFLRSILGVGFLFVLAYFFEAKPTAANLQASLILLLINGILLFGLSKIFWIEGIHRITITKAISLASIAPAFTLFFAYLFLNDIPTTSQILGLLPILAGTWLLTRR